MIVFRIRSSHLKAVVFGVLVLAGGFGVGSALASHDPTVIHACVSKSNGSLRVVNSASDCRSNETTLEWSIESPISIPQTCPTGQFVTGIDANGQLMCAAPTTGGGAISVCGNGVVEGTEACDTGGESASCDDNCTIAMCGDGTLNTTAGEQCDTGGAPSPTCTLSCRASVCGDGIVNPVAGEQCDDANTVNGDGCSSVCRIEGP
jgi:cysteine-rich repeat protein